MNNRLFAAVLFAGLCLAGPASAQAADALAPAPTPVVNDTSLHLAQPSSIDRPSAAVRRTASAPAAPLPSTGEHMGEAKAEMLVGAAAIIVGAMIGGDGGRVLMIGGAVVGLYGLWNYAR